MPHRRSTRCRWPASWCRPSRPSSPATRSRSIRGVISVTMIHAGEATNVVPDCCEIQGTVRTFTTEVLDLIEQRMRELSRPHLRRLRRQLRVRVRAQLPAHGQQRAGSRLRARGHAGPGRARAASGAGTDHGRGGLRLHAAGQAGRLRVDRATATATHRGMRTAMTRPCTLHNPDYDFNDELIPIGRQPTGSSWPGAGWASRSPEAAAARFAGKAAGWWLRAVQATGTARSGDRPIRAGHRRSGSPPVRTVTVMLGAIFQPAPPVMMHQAPGRCAGAGSRTMRWTAPAMAKVPPLVRASLVLVGKSRTSPVGTCRPAVPDSSARSMMPWPGKIMPPQKAAVGIDGFHRHRRAHHHHARKGCAGRRALRRWRAPIMATQRSEPRREGWS